MKPRELTADEKAARDHIRRRMGDVEGFAEVDLPLRSRWDAGRSAELSLPAPVALRMLREAARRLWATTLPRLDGEPVVDGQEWTSELRERRGELSWMGFSAAPGDRVLRYTPAQRQMCAFGNQPPVPLPPWVVALLTHDLAWIPSVRPDWSPLRWSGAAGAEVVLTLGLMGRLRHESEVRLGMVAVVSTVERHFPRACIGLFPRWPRNDWKGRVLVRVADTELLPETGSASTPGSGIDVVPVLPVAAPDAPPADPRTWSWASTRVIVPQRMEEANEPGWSEAGGAPVSEAAAVACTPLGSGGWPRGWPLWIKVMWWGPDTDRSGAENAMFEGVYALEELLRPRLSARDTLAEPVGRGPDTLSVGADVGTSSAAVVTSDPDLTLTDPDRNGAPPLSGWATLSGEPRDAALAGCAEYLKLVHDYLPTGLCFPTRSTAQAALGDSANAWHLGWLPQQGGPPGGEDPRGRSVIDTWRRFKSPDLLARARPAQPGGDDGAKPGQARENLAKGCLYIYSRQLGSVLAASAARPDMTGTSLHFKRREKVAVAANYPDMDWGADSSFRKVWEEQVASGLRSGLAALWEKAEVSAIKDDDARLVITKTEFRLDGQTPDRVIGFGDLGGHTFDGDARCDLAVADDGSPRADAGADPPTLNLAAGGEHLIDGYALQAAAGYPQNPGAQDALESRRQAFDRLGAELRAAVDRGTTVTTADWFRTVLLKRVVALLGRVIAAATRRAEPVFSWSEASDDLGSGGLLARAPELPIRVMLIGEGWKLAAMSPPGAPAGGGSQMSRVCQEVQRELARSFSQTIYVHYSDKYHFAKAARDLARRAARGETDRDDPARQAHILGLNALEEVRGGERRVRGWYDAVPALGAEESAPLWVLNAGSGNPQDQGALDDPWARAFLPYRDGRYQRLQPLHKLLDEAPELDPTRFTESWDEQAGASPLEAWFERSGATLYALDFFELAQAETERMAPLDPGSLDATGAPFGAPGETDEDPV